MGSNVQYLQRHEIDAKRWDECITQSDNGLIYAHSWWLDALADNWCALVWNNYEAVMPLTWRKKLGIRYLYQPWFTATLGMFQKKGAAESLADFLPAVPAPFRYWDIDINEANHVAGFADKKPETWQRTNMVIPQGSYAHARERYSRLAKRKIKKAVEAGLVISEAAGIEEVVTRYRENYGSRHPAIREKDYRQLITGCTVAREKGYVTCYTAAQPDGQILGFYLLLHDDRFSYSLLGGSTAAGKKAGAFHLLTDRAIKDTMDHNRSFRFEGSDIPGIAFFNRQFGPETVTYLHLRRNTLPFPLNILK
ncbi:MAG: GNAT family N-acetyltransferase [Chitinophagaceae bacterium]|nr:GNAT family N-acetyltransferase [Chitinophagaceae bacterium]MCW5929595.1 GNAT family N-acetyltransferase [Chitinophagaceae bacterium]